MCVYLCVFVLCPCRCAPHTFFLLQYSTTIIAIALLTASSRDQAHDAIVEFIDPVALSVALPAELAGPVNAVLDQHDFVCLRMRGRVCVECMCIYFCMYIWLAHTPGHFFSSRKQIKKIANGGRGFGTLDATIVCTNESISLL